MKLSLGPTAYKVLMNPEHKNGEPQLYAKFMPMNYEIQTRGENAWVIFTMGDVISKDGEMVYEPMPSNRTEEFIQSTRFDSPENALKFLQEIVDKSLAEGKF